MVNKPNKDEQQIAAGCDAVMDKALADTIPGTLRPRFKTWQIVLSVVAAVGVLGIGGLILVAVGVEIGQAAPATPEGAEEIRVTTTTTEAPATTITTLSTQEHAEAEIEAHATTTTKTEAEELPYEDHEFNYLLALAVTLDDRYSDLGTTDEYVRVGYIFCDFLVGAQESGESPMFVGNSMIELFQYDGHVAGAFSHAAVGSLCEEHAEYAETIFDAVREWELVEGSENW